MQTSNESFLYTVIDGASNFKEKIISYREQIEIRNSWLEERINTILPSLMLRENIDCWVVMAREYNEDPVIMSLLPASMLSCRRTTILLFSLQNDGTLKRYSLSRPGTGVDHLYQGVWTNPLGQDWGNLDIMPFTTKQEATTTEPETQFQCLARIIKEIDPKRIGLNYSSDFAFGDGLTKSLYEEFSNNLDSNLKSRIVSAENICVGWLETRTENEIYAYNGIVQIAHGIISEAFSSRVILPGVTTNADVKFYMMQKVIDLGLVPWFDFEVSIIREEIGAIGKETIILPGDVLHCDVGLKYLGLCTDTQHNAYVLKLDEIEPPKGIQQLQLDLNKLQDITLSKYVEGYSGNQILKDAREEAIRKGLNPCIYTHPIGVHGHGAGPTIGLWDMQDGVKGRGDYPLNNNTLYSLELNITTTIPEWNNQKITIGAETDVLFKDGKTYYVAGQQTKMYLIK
ncbi:M24 family metallopeptidase [Mycoplasmatota bacterium zrk1]